MKIVYTIIFLFLFLWGKSQWMCGDSITDSRDGKKYPTVQIGTQCWIAANLNVGEMISGSAMPSDNNIIEKYCYDDNPANCLVFGGLYTWNEMMAYSNAEGATGICPTGWHVPSDGEIIELEVTLGMDLATALLENIWRGTDQGTQMLAGGTSGLNILFGGARTNTGTFMLVNTFAFINTSSEAGPNSWRRCLRNNDSRVGRFNTFPKDYALSVRCVKDAGTSSNGNVPYSESLLKIFFANQMLNVVLHTKQYGLATIGIYDMYGKLIMSKEFFIDHENMFFQLPIPSITAGIYIVKFQHSGNIISQKIFIH